MGEIVRVLKWRLDLDASGMADGIDKAATAAEKLAKSAAEVGEKGTAGLKKTSAAAKETETAFEGLNYETQQVEKYVRLLEKGSGSPLAVERNAKMAEAAFNVLATAAGKAGKAIPEAFSDRTINAIERATSSAERMNVAVQKLGGLPPTKLDNVTAAVERTQKSTQAASVALQNAALRSQEMASGMGLLASAGGPAGMALASVASQGSAAGNALVVAAGQMAIFAAAAKIGWESGRKLDEELKKVGVDLSDGLIDAGLKQLEERLKTTSEAAQNATPSFLGLVSGTAALDHGLASLPQKLKDAALDLTLLRDGADGAGGAFRNLAADIATDDARLTSHTQALGGQIVARRALLNEVQRTSVAFKDALPGWESTADHARKLKEQIDAVALKFQSFGKTGADWKKEVEANQASFAAFVEMLQKEKVAIDTLPPSLQAAVAYLKELQATSTAAATAMGGLAAATVEAMDGQTGALTKFYQEASKSFETLQKFRTEVLDSIPAVQAATAVSAAYADSVKKINDAYLSTQKAHEDAIRRINEEDLAMAQLVQSNGQAAYSIDSIGEAWEKATGQCAGFTTEVRRGRKEVEETDPTWTAFIDSLAGVSDEYERMIPWVGALIAELEKGNITGAEFQKQIEAWRTGFMQIQGMSGQMFGDIDTLFNKLNHLMNEFTRGGKGGSENRFTPKPRG